VDARWTYRTYRTYRTYPTYQTYQTHPANPTYSTHQTYPTHPPDLLGLLDRPDLGVIPPPGICYNSPWGYQAHGGTGSR
jgi:hypothetical protein